MKHKKLIVGGLVTLTFVVMFTVLAGNQLGKSANDIESREEPRLLDEGLLEPSNITYIEVFDYTGEAKKVVRFEDESDIKNISSFFKRMNRFEIKDEFSNGIEDDRYVVHIVAKDRYAPGPITVTKGAILLQGSMIEISEVDYADLVSIIMKSKGEVVR